jgi:TonB family protein
MTLPLLLLFAISIASPIALASGDTGDVAMTAEFATDLDASGRIVAFKPIDRAAKATLASIEAEVSTWSFEPGRVDGRPAATSTTVMIQLVASEAGGKYVFRIVNALTGPRYGHAPPPRYPAEAVEAKDTGTVELLVDFDSKGRTTGIAVHRSNASPMLREAAASAVKAWVFVPEQVDGRGVPASVIVPINFCLASPCPDLPADPAGNGTDGPRLVGEPAARIRSRGESG